MKINSRQRKTLGRIFETPTRSDIGWSEVESLFKAMGAELQEGSGSRIRVKFNGAKAVFHKPHPHPYIKKYAVEDVRDFLQEAEVVYE